MSILIEGVAEALELAAQLGIDTSSLAEAIEGGPLDAPIADAWMAANEDFRQYVLDQLRDAGPLPGEALEDRRRELGLHRLDPRPQRWWRQSKRSRRSSARVRLVTRTAASAAYPELWVSRPGGRAGRRPGEEGPGSAGQGGR